MQLRCLMYLTLNDVDVNNKRVLLRVDFNVPLDNEGNVVNDKKIRETLPTLNYLQQHNAKTIIVTHVGRPGDGSAELKVDRIVRRLSTLLGKPITKTDDCVGHETEKIVYAMRPKDIVMLENVRFNSGEKDMDKLKREAFGQQLAALCDIYVNDAFANSHRDHASMTAVPRFVTGCIGLSAQRELEKIGQALQHKKKPFVTIVGGLKADKLNAITHLLTLSDYVLLGGSLSLLFTQIKGHSIGKSRIDVEGVEHAQEQIKKLLSHTNLVLPVDFLVADKFDAHARCEVVAADRIPADMMAVDIGPKTIELYKKYIATAKTVIWNGPMGAFELDPFEHGTAEIARAIARSGAVSIVGGGDSSTAIEKFHLLSSITHVATGGGASLMLLEGKTLPAIAALEESYAQHNKCL